MRHCLTARACNLFLANKAVATLLRRLVFPLVLLAELSAGVSAAEDVSAKQAQRERPRVALLNTFPYYFIDKYGTAKGFMTELAELVFTGINIGYDASPMPLGRVIRQSAAGIQDMAILYRLPEMFPDLEFFATVGCLEIILVPLKKSGIKGLDDIAGKRIAYMQGGRFDRVFASKVDIIGMPIANVRNIFAMAVISQVDAVVFNNMAFESSKTFPQRATGVYGNIWGEFAAPIALLEVELSFVVSRKSAFRSRVPEIEAFVLSAWGQRKIKTLFRKYGVETGGKCTGSSNK